MLLLIGCSKPSAEEMYNKGVDAQNAEQYDAAIDLYQELIKAYPDSTQTPKAIYAIGNIYYNKGNLYKSLEYYRQLVKNYPYHATSSNAAFSIANIYNDRLKQYDSAKIAYESFIKEYPDDHLVKSAKFSLKYLGKSDEEIFNIIQQLAEEETRSLKKTKKK
jgi:TolA-binding protein